VHLRNYISWVETGSGVDTETAVGRPSPGFHMNPRQVAPHVVTVVPFPYLLQLEDHDCHREYGGQVEEVPVRPTGPT
jgi:hypothetical protein